MKCQILFSGKNKKNTSKCCLRFLGKIRKNISKCCLLIILPIVLSIKYLEILILNELHRFVAGNILKLILLFFGENKP